MISPPSFERCGIANFAAQLSNALVELGDVEVEKYTITRTGPRPEGRTIRRDELDDYRKAADQLNEARPDVVVLQHEYGLFGGAYGAYILALVQRLRRPIATVMHTVLPQPDEVLRNVTAELVGRSGMTAVICTAAERLLQREYGAANISVLPHGYPELPQQPRPAELGENPSRQGAVILALGLLGPDKGIDLAISAMCHVRKKFPTARLWVVGCTHPNELHCGIDVYRAELIAKVEQSKLGDNVAFVNRYISLSSHLAWIQHADLVLTLHRDLRQVSSGTLTYAVGCARPVISTSYRYAEDLAVRGAGILLTQENVEAVGGTMIRVLSDARLKNELISGSAALAPSITWRQIARMYREQFIRL